VTSATMDEIMQSVQLLADAGSGPAMPHLSAAEGWFVPANVSRLRRGFSELDADRDGLLSQEDFARSGDKLL
jgi:hypothetical protein